MSKETREDMLSLWRSSKKDRMQIQIMSQLADCSEEEIENMLRESGLDFPEVQRAKKKEPKPERITAADLTELLEKKINHLNEKIVHLELENRRMYEDLKSAYKYIQNL